MKVEPGYYDANEDAAKAEVYFVKITDSNGNIWQIYEERNGLRITMPTEQTYSGNLMTVSVVKDNLVNIELHDKDAWAHCHKAASKGDDGCNTQRPVEPVNVGKNPLKSKTEKK